MRILMAVFVGSCFWVSSLGAENSGWLNTYEAGLKKAVEEEKDVLISFMGSDWCEQCKVLSAAVLSKEIFTTPISERFVLVELDFPQGSPTVAERNEPIRVRYGVKGYPVLLLMDALGDPYGEVQYNREWKVADYLRAIQAEDSRKLTREEARGEFASATDDKLRTKALEKFLGAVPETTIARVYAEEFETLRKVSQDQSPLVIDIVKKERLEEMQRDMQGLMSKRRFQEAIVRVDEFLAIENLDPHEKQAGFALKYYSLMGLGHYEKAVSAAESVRDANPDSPMGKQAPRLVQRAQAALGSVKEEQPTKQPQTIEGGHKLVESKETTGSVAKTEAVAPKEVSAGSSEREPKSGPSVAEQHKQSLATLELAHQALAAAEEALAKAEADLEAARERHLSAHRKESATRKLVERERAKEDAVSEQIGAKISPEIEAFEKRAADLRKQAEELRRTAEQLRKETQE